MDAVVRATSELAQLEKGRIRHLVPVSERLSEAESVQVLVPSEGFVEEVRLAGPLACLHELIDAGRGHFGSRCEEQDIARVDPGELDALKAIISPMQEALRVEDMEDVKQGPLDLRVQAGVLQVLELSHEVPEGMPQV